jgi:[ribosomal protein S18]-alanine N-acetyltransferase
MLRPAASPDLPGVMEIETSSFSRPWSLDSFRRLLGRERTAFVVAEVDGRVVAYGVLWWVEDEGEIANLAVRPEARRKGLARLMLGELLSRAAREDLSFVFLEVRATNRPAIDLYASLGFEQVGIRRGYYQNPREDALTLRFELKRRAS